MFSCGRFRWSSCFFWLIAAGFLGVSIAHGNPLPPSGLAVHVDAGAPGFCEQSPLTECTEIVQYTSEVGELAFGLYYVSYFEEYSPYELSVEINWPEQWTHREIEICGGADGYWSATSATSAEIDVNWHDCPPWEGGIKLYAIVHMGVYGPGTMTVETLDASVGCPPTVYDDWPVPGMAQAGVQCSYCFRPCDLSNPCQPVLTPATLSLSADVGGTAEETIHIDMPREEWESPCDAFVDATVDWLSVDYAYDPYLGEGSITVSADASELEPGGHVGYVRCRSEDGWQAGCTTCTHVLFEVIANQGAPGEGPLDDEPAKVTSWGHVKRIYR